MLFAQVVILRVKRRLRIERMEKGVREIADFFLKKIVMDFILCQRERLRGGWWGRGRLGDVLLQWRKERLEWERWGRLWEGVDDERLRCWRWLERWEGWVWRGEGEGRNVLRVGGWDPDGRTEKIRLDKSIEVDGVGEQGSRVKSEDETIPIGDQGHVIWGRELRIFPDTGAD
jgi:hypothetical protein